LGGGGPRFESGRPDVRDGTITAIAAALLALTIFVAFGGPGIAAWYRFHRGDLYGDRLDDDERRRDLEE
jgi:hypothetical protein